MLDEPKFFANSDRLPPQNLEAEESILGGILLDPEAISRVADLLKPEIFSIKSHQEIYRATLTLHNQGKATDLMTVTTWLADHNLLDKVGGTSKIAQLVDRTVSAVNIDQYAKLILDKYIRRKLITSGHEIIELGYQTGTDLETILDQAEQRVFSITQERPQQGLVPISETLIHAFQDIENLNQGTALPGIPCNFYDLDAMTGGFQRSDLIVVAGRPSMGKCCAYDTTLLQADGSLTTIQEIYQAQKCQLLTLGSNWQFQITQPSAFVDDGIKPVFRVTTKLGRFVETTLTHPYLTLKGWRPLSELKPGQKIAVPRQLEVFGTETLPEYQVKLLAYFLGDGGLTHSIPLFTNNNPAIQSDFINAASFFSSVKVRRVESANRAASFSVTKEFNEVSTNRKDFSLRLQNLISSNFTSSREFAQCLQVSPSLISNWTHSQSAPSKNNFTKICNFLDLQPEELAPHGYSSISQNSKNSLTLWLESLGLWGKNAHQKTIPSIVFRLNKSLIALLINRLFATDGWATLLSSGQSQLGYCSVSETLVRQIQHLLLRFGIIASLRRKSVKYQQSYRLAWQLNITDAQSIQKFISEIGIWGKEEALAKIQTALAEKRYQTNCDLIPQEIWEYLAVIKQDEPWSALARRAGIVGYRNIHVGKRGLSRQRLATLAVALDNLSLQQLANSEVYWDEIASIEYVGEKQVYDLTIPETHNFVANDICVHNTSFALNIAHNIAAGQGLPVAVFSLEMSKEQLVQRLLSSEAKIESNRLRSGRLSQMEWEPLSHALGVLSELPLFIDDTANITVTQMRSQTRRLQAEQGKGLGLILIDYLQLMEGGGDNRVQELSKITRQLKGLARELGVPVIALSQLSRSVESRTNKRPMMSDLRESGCLAGDSLVTLADSGLEVPIQELVGKSGFWVWGLNEKNMRLETAIVSHVFSTGIKPVFTLKTKLGRQIRATANHKFLTLQGWKRLDELSFNEYLCLPSNLPIADAELAFPRQRILSSVGSSFDKANLRREPILAVAEITQTKEQLALSNREVYWDEIVAIIPDGEVEVFDLTVPGLHNFIANNIIVHNSIEQDADLVIMLYRDEYYNPDTVDRGIAEVIITKHRNGPVGTVKLKFDPEFTNFRNLANPNR